MIIRVGNEDYEVSKAEGRHVQTALRELAEWVKDAGRPVRDAGEPDAVLVPGAFSGGERVSHAPTDDEPEEAAEWADPGRRGGRSDDHWLGPDDGGHKVVGRDIDDTQRRW